jgi:hypothetical protein
MSVSVQNPRLWSGCLRDNGNRDIVTRMQGLPHQKPLYTIDESEKFWLPREAARNLVALHIPFSPRAKPKTSPDLPLAPVPPSVYLETFGGVGWQPSEPSQTPLL